MITRMFLVLFFILCLLNLNCTTPKENIKKNNIKLNDRQSKEVDNLLNIIKNLNQNIPKTIKTNISLNATMNKNSYNAEGTAYYINKPQKLKIKLSDLVFKSPMLEVLQKDNTIKVYNPVNETLYTRNTNNLLKTNLLENNINFIINFSLGKISLIKNYQVKKLVTKSKREQYLLLENNKYYQTISFKNNMPNKVLFINKQNKEKLEIFFYNKTKIGNYSFFKKIKAFAQKSRNRLTINFYRIKTDIKLNEKNIFRLKVPKGVKNI